MIIGNAKVFIDGTFQNTCVKVKKERIVAIGNMPYDTNAGGCYLVPGLVDIHTHGAVGGDFSDGNTENLGKMAAYYAQNGITAFLASTMTLPEETLTRAVTAVKEFVPQKGQARCVGIHLEGPFLNKEKRGAQAEVHLRKPDIGLFHRLSEASGNRIKMVTVAPEEPGAMDFIREVSKTCTVALGHSCADYDTAMEAFAAGASHVTHLFNGMTAFSHRQPGLVGAAFDSEVTAELICDGLHIHPAVLRTAFRLLGQRAVGISDSLRCAGMPDGDYTLGGQPITVKGGKATLTGTDTLAGSCGNLLDSIRNLVSFGVPLETALYAATAAPAKAIGLDHEIGSIAPGMQADLLLLTEDLQLQQAFLGTD